MQPTVSMVFIMAVILGALLSRHAGAQGRGPQVQLPDGPGRELVQGTCAQCHGLHLITGSLGYTKEG
jgi:mono/diheme cytochrome c family protein